MKKQTILLILIILTTLLIKIYLFVLTMNQSLWWDEAEYLNIARTFATSLPLPNLGIVRPILLSLIISPLYQQINSLWLVENVSRGIMVAFSIFITLGFYLFGKEIYNKSVGLLAAFFISVFSLMLFLTTKILTDIPSFTFLIFGIYFFYLYLKKKTEEPKFKEPKSEEPKYKNPKYLYFAAITFAIGTLFRINILVVFFLLLLIYVIKREIKIKEAVISCVIFGLIMVPYIIYGYVVYNSFVFTGAVKYVSPSNNYYLANFMFNITNYVIVLFKNILMININYQIATLILVFSFFLAIFTLKKEKEKGFYIMLIIAIPLISLSFFIGHGEDRYVIDCLLGIFLSLSLFVIYLYNQIKKKNKIFAYIFIIALILLFGSVQIWNGYSRTKDSISSTKYVKEAGFWARDNILKDEYSISTNPMQIAYYSNKYSYIFPKTKKELDVLLKEKNIKYFIIFKSEKLTTWTTEYTLNEYNLNVVKETDNFVVYKLNDE